MHLEITWESCCNADPDLVGLGWDLKLVISNKHLGNSTAPGPWTTL